MKETSNSKTDSAGTDDVVVRQSESGSDLFMDLLGRLDMDEEVTPPKDIFEEPPEKIPEKLVERNPVGEGEHVVRPGECLSSIAYEKGHFWQTIWEDPANTKLREARDEHRILLPDDRLHIPRLRMKSETCTTEQRHRFRKKGVPEKLHIRLQSSDNKPLSGVSYLIEIDGALKSDITSGDGDIVVSIPPNAKKGKIVIPDLDETIPLTLGTLDPVVEMSGVQARLNNLGYYIRPADGKWSESLEEAIRVFQGDQQLQVTGELDENTRKALVKVYGS